MAESIPLGQPLQARFGEQAYGRDRKSTRLNSSHDQISYAVFCLKKKITVMLAAHIIGVIWKNPENSPTTGNWATVITVGVICVVGYLLAFGTHWPPATDSYDVQ